MIEIWELIARSEVLFKCLSDNFRKIDGNISFSEPGITSSEIGPILRVLGNPVSERVVLL
jgi:hypothetical protein